jgi:hypothetical protein
MKRATDIGDATVGGGVAVLMARIVDRAGVAIRRADVSSIEYSIFERGRRGKWLAVVAGHERAMLHVDDLLLERLVFGGSWTLDVAGYNFRHEIAAGPIDFPKVGKSYEIIYMFTTIFGEKVAVRFVLGTVKP